MHDKDIAVAILERQENDEFDDPNHTRYPHRFEPHLDISDQLDVVDVAVCRRHMRSACITTKPNAEPNPGAATIINIK